LQNNFYNSENQLSAFWDIEVLNSNNSSLLKTRVVSSTIPFLKLNVERQITGLTTFKDVTFPEEFSITLRESTDFLVYNFFKDWLSKFYNEEENTFKTFSSKFEYEQSLLNLKFTFYKGVGFAFGFGTGIESVKIEKDNMVKSFSFIAKNCKPLGFNNIDLQYDTSTALEVTINMIAEQITKEI
jgi:hypothetical protein